MKLKFFQACFFKKCIAFMLVIVLSMVCMACGTTQTDNKVSDLNSSPAGDEGEYGYVAEYLTLPEGADIYSALIDGDVVYYTSYTDENNVQYIGWDFQKKEQVYSWTIEHTSVAEMAGHDGQNDFSLNILGFCLNDNGPSFLVNFYSWTGDYDYTQSYYLLSLNMDGTIKEMKDVTSALLSGSNNDENFYIGNVVFDDKGRLVVLLDKSVLLIDEEGNLIGNISPEGVSWINSSFVFEGEIYISYMVADFNGYKLSKIDFDSKSMKDSFSAEHLTYNTPCDGKDGKLLYSDGTSLYSYQTKTGEEEKLLTWLNSNINGETISKVGMSSEGDIIVLANDWTSGSADLILLKKTLRSEMKQTQKITVASLYEDANIKAAAVAFNKEQSEYHIDVKSYYDWNSGITIEDAETNMLNDLTGSNPPDIICLGYVNWEMFQSKGALMDLSSFVSSSSNVKKEDFFACAIDSFSKDGKIYGVAKSFTIHTLVGSKKDFGNRTGWTIGEMLDYAKSHPDATLLNYSTKESMLTSLLSYSWDSFVDWSTGECHFQDSSFIDILEYIKTLPDTFDYDSQTKSTPALIGSGQILMDDAYVYSFSDLQIYGSVFADGYTAIGFPTVDGQGGSQLTLDGSFGISSSCKTPEIAWQFIEKQLTNYSDYEYMLPTNKKQFQKMADKELEHAGEESGSSVMYEDDWTYSYHYSTQEEMDELTALIERSVYSGSVNQDIMQIITEEASALYSGQKDVNSVASVIQSRVSIYVSEHR